LAVFVSRKSYAIGLWGTRALHLTPLRVFQPTLWLYVKSGAPGLFT